MINYWCNQHRDENGNRLACGLCDNKGKCQSNEEPLICPNSQEPLKKMGETMSGGYAKFNSLPAEQKRAVMKKRAHRHFKSHIEEKKVQMNRAVDPRYEPPKTKKIK